VRFRTDATEGCAYGVQVGFRARGSLAWACLPPGFHPPASIDPQSPFVRLALTLAIKW